MLKSHPKLRREAGLTAGLVETNTEPHPLLGSDPFCLQLQKQVASNVDRVI